MACLSLRRTFFAAVLLLSVSRFALAQPAPAVSASPDAGAATDPAVVANPATPQHPPSAVAAAADSDDDADDGDAPDDDQANETEIRQESDDLEAMKQAESVVTDPGAGAATRLFGAASRLGGASALGAGLRDALGDPRAYQPLLPDSAEIDSNIALAFDIAKAKGDYDIPVEMRAEVAQWITFFQHGGRKFFLRWLARSSRYIPVMRDILRQEGLPEDTVFLSMIESGFSTYAYSWARASGPWQFVEHTGRRYGLRVDFWVDERRDPIKSTRAAARYLRMMHEEFGDWYLAWAGYNAGENKIRRGINKYGTHDFWQMCSERHYLRPETRNYVPKLIAAALVTKHPAQFGFTNSEVDWQRPLESETVSVVNPTDLSVIAKAAQCSLDDLKTLNPELRRWLTPPATEEHPYVLRVPKGHKLAFEKNYPALAPKERMVFRIVRVRRGDTLSEIALHNRSFPELIMRMNGLSSARKLRVGTELMVPVQSKTVLAKVEAEEKTGKRKRTYDASDEIPAGTPSHPQQASGTVVHKRVDGKDQVTYGVASGDSLWVIGQKFGVSVDELKKWNSLHGRRPKIMIGQQLVVYPRTEVPSTAVAAAKPAAAKPSAVPATRPEVKLAAARPSPTDKVTRTGKTKRIVHTLQPGDSLWSLSQQYGVTVDALKRLNHVHRHQKIRAGDTLVIEVAENG